jgi:hypothetical protein
MAPGTETDGVVLPAQLSSLLATPSLAPRCLCCSARMSWQEWAGRAWSSCSSRRWASLCAQCSARNSHFAALLCASHAYY